MFVLSKQNIYPRLNRGTIKSVSAFGERQNLSVDCIEVSYHLYYSRSSGWSSQSGDDEGGEDGKLGKEFHC